MSNKSSAEARREPTEPLSTLRLNTVSRTAAGAQGRVEIPRRILGVATNEPAAVSSGQEAADYERLAAEILQIRDIFHLGVVSDKSL